MVGFRKLLYVFIVLLACISAACEKKTVSKPDENEEVVKTVEFHYVVDPRSSRCLDERAALVSYFFTFQSSCVYDSLYNAIPRSSPGDFVSVRVEEVPLKASEATAVYFDSERNIVGIGKDRILWDAETSNCIIDVPAYYKVEAGAASLNLKVSSYKIPLGEYVRFTSLLNVGNDAEPIDVTDLTVFSDIDEKLLAPAKDVKDDSIREFTPGYYHSLASGVCSQVKITLKVSGGDLEDILAGAVYITDNSDSLEIEYKTSGNAERDSVYDKIASVRYNFLNNKNRSVYYTDFISFNSKAAAVEGVKIVLAGIPTSSTKVSAAYYDSGRRMIAAGVDEITWHNENDVEKSVLEKPLVLPLDEDEDNVAYKITADKLALDVGEQVRLSVFVQPRKVGIQADITPFVEFSSFESLVLSAAKDAFDRTNDIVTPGCYKAVSIGEVKGYAYIYDPSGTVEVETSSKIIVGRKELKNLEFNYLKLSGDKKLDAKIYSVRYNFVDNRSRSLMLTDNYPIYKTGDKDNQVISVDNIPAGAVAVNAVYYGDGGGEILACGRNEIQWNDGVTFVHEPVVCRTAKNKGKIMVSNYVIAPGEVFRIRAFLIPENNDLKLVDVTPLVTVSGINGDIIQVIEQKAALVKRCIYKGIKYGVNSDIKVEFDKTFSAAAADIYVTDQKAEELEIQAADINGTQIYVKQNEDDVSESYLLFVENDKFNNNVTVYNDLGQSSASVDCGNHVESVAVNAQPYTAIVNYSRKEGRGPTPEAADMTRYTQFTVDFINVDCRMEANALIVSGMADDKNIAGIDVIGEYGELKGKAVCRCIRAESHLALFNESDTLGGTLSVPPDGNPDEAYIQNLFLKGFFEVNDGKDLFTVPFDLPFYLMENQGYPKISFEGEKDDKVVFYQDEGDYSIKVYAGAKEQTYDVFVVGLTGLPECVKVKYRISGSDS